MERRSLGGRRSYDWHRFYGVPEVVGERWARGRNVVWTATCMGLHEPVVIQVGPPVKLTVCSDHYPTKDACCGGLVALGDLK